MRKLKLLLKYLHELGAVTLLNYLYDRFVIKEKILKIKIKGLHDKVLIRNHPSDISIFSQIFVYKEYDVEINMEVKTIIDCGANIGLASLFFLKKFPNIKIIAIEPEANNFLLLKRNLGLYKNVTCINKGVWSKTANLEVLDFGGGHSGFIVKEIESPNKASILAVSIDEIMSQFQLNYVDIVKLDIEGSEEQVFSNYSKWIEQVSFIFCEIHEGMKPGLTAKIKTKLLSSFDLYLNGEYHIFKKKKLAYFKK
jgi:FkbM family methyltransferase